MASALKQGPSAVLPLSLLAMLFPFSWAVLSRFLRGEGRTVLLFTCDDGLLPQGWPTPPTSRHEGEKGEACLGRQDSYQANPRL